MKKTRRKKLSPTLVKKIKDNQNNLCAYCRQNKELEIDHIIRLSCGGSNEEYNLQGLCRECHKAKESIWDKIHRKITERLDKKQKRKIRRKKKLAEYQMRKWNKYH